MYNLAEGVRNQKVVVECLGCFFFCGHLTHYFTHESREEQHSICFNKLHRFQSEEVDPNRC